MEWNLHDRLYSYYLTKSLRKNKLNSNIHIYCFVIRYPVQIVNTCTCQCLSIWVTENLNVKWGAMLVGEINWLYVVHVFVCLCSFFLHENGISSTDRSNFTTRRFVVVTNTKKILQFCPNSQSVFYLVSHVCLWVLGWYDIDTSVTKHFIEGQIFICYFIEAWIFQWNHFPRFYYNLV